jgi:hypothetical protein
MRRNHFIRGGLIMTRAQREKELSAMLHTEAGRASLVDLYRHLYLSPGAMVPPGFLIEQELVRMILAKEFPDEDAE